LLTSGQYRSPQLKVPRGLRDETRLTEGIGPKEEEFARYSRPGMRCWHHRERIRMITGMLTSSGWTVSHKHVEPISQQ
jgi:hypothetical protein